MTDQNTPAAEAVERVATAIYEADGIYSDDSVFLPFTWQEAVQESWAGVEYTRLQAKNAIQAHTAYLWKRAMQPEFVDALGDALDWEDVWTREHVAHTALTLLLGPRPEGDTDAD